MLWSFWTDRTFWILFVWEKTHLLPEEIGGLSFSFFPRSGGLASHGGRKEPARAIAAWTFLAQSINWRFEGWKSNRTSPQNTNNSSSNNNNKNHNNKELKSKKTTRVACCLVNLRPLSVGLCTATMNRLWQLKKALPLTLMQAFPFRNRHYLGQVERRCSCSLQNMYIEAEITSSPMIVNQTKCFINSLVRFSGNSPTLSQSLNRCPGVKFMWSTSAAMTAPWRGWRTTAEPWTTGLVPLFFCWGGWYL